MKVTNADAPGAKAARATRGSVSTNVAGAKGVIFRDPVTESAGQLRDITLRGLTLYDNEDGTGIIEAGTGTGGSPSGNFGGDRGLSIDGMVPYEIPADNEFVVPLFKQGLFHMTIDVVGTLTVDGYLIEVA